MHAVTRKQCINIRNHSEAEAFVEGSLRATILSFPQKTYALNIQASRYELPAIDLWSCAYRVPIALRFYEGDYFRIQLHQQGQGSTRIGKHEFAVSSNQAVLSTADAQIKFGTDFVQRVLRIKKDGLLQKMSAFAGTTLMRPLAFDAAFDCSNPKFQIFRQSVDFIERLMDSSSTPIPVLLLAELEQSIIASTLYAFSHNYSALLERQSAQAAPWQVCRVEDYIEAHWDQAIMIEDLVALSGCSARSLFRAFQQSRGYSPLAFAKQVRLQHARRMLLASEETTVTGVAFACGFPDLGRFSRDYALVFGELPSETLKRYRRFVPRNGRNRLIMALSD